MFKDSTTELIFSKIDQDELVHLVMALADISSLTGHEQEIANFILNWFDENGFHSIKQVVEGERFNAIGVLRGEGGGSSLTFNGHLDTMIPSQPIEKAYVSDGRIYGNEVANMRAGLAAIMIAAKAIKEARVKLAGDLIVATVVGEICTGAIGPFQGPQDRAEGIGTRHLLANGVQSDYAIVADGSGYAIIRAQPGVAYFRITTKGAVKFTPYAKRPENVDESENAIIKITRIIDTIENWARDYEKRSVYKFPGGQIEPKASINAVQGGMPITRDGWRLPFKVSSTPQNCDLYVDVRIPPGANPVGIKHQLEGALADLPFEWEIEMFRSQSGYEGTGPEVDYLSSTVEKAYECVCQSKPPTASIAHCSMWTDTNLYWEIGIPAVKWGPSDSGKYPNRTVAEIQPLTRATKVYSLIALEVCGEASE